MKNTRFYFTRRVLLLAVDCSTYFTRKKKETKVKRRKNIRNEGKKINKTKYMKCKENTNFLATQISLLIRLILSCRKENTLRI